MNLEVLHTPCDCDEYFGMLKYKLLETVKGKSADPVVISFTSYLEGEGVSSSITHFARELSHDRRCKVLLVDFNVQHPSLHKYFPKPETGHHNGKDQHGEAVEFEPPNNKIVANDHLHVITTSKRSDPRPIQQNKYEVLRFFIRAKKEYDFILLDCPPLRHNNFATLLASKADYTVLVVESHRVRSQVLCDAISQLEQLGANILGVILNKRQYPIPRFIYHML